MSTTKVPLDDNVLLIEESVGGPWVSCFDSSSSEFEVTCIICYFGVVQEIKVMN